jgi:hypothetical protein
MLMRYHIGLGIGHVYTQRQASSNSYQETTGYTTRVDDMEVECVPGLPDDEEELSGGIVEDVESGGEYNDFCDEMEGEEEEEEASGDEEFLVDEDVYGY